MRYVKFRGCGCARCRCRQWRCDHQPRGGRFGGLVAGADRSVSIGRHPRRGAGRRPCRRARPERGLHGRRSSASTGTARSRATATAIVANVTIGNPTAQSYLAIYPADTSLPLSSNLNWVAGQGPTPNQVTVSLSASGAINIFNYNGHVDVIADISGYYVPGGTGAGPAGPGRSCRSRRRSRCSGCSRCCRSRRASWAGAVGRELGHHETATRSGRLSPSCGRDRMPALDWRSAPSRSVRALRAGTGSAAAVRNRQSEPVGGQRTRRSPSATRSTSSTRRSPSTRSGSTCTTSARTSADSCLLPRSRWRSTPAW